MSNKKILFVFAHPDDESLWTPGLIKEFSSLEGFHPYVLCLWGSLENMDPYRESQFYKSTQILGSNSFLVNSIEQDPISYGLQKMEVLLNEIDLIVTHSPYGDEHEHRHHKQLYSMCRDKSSQSPNTGFSYFSFLTPPYEYKSKMLAGLRREKSHLLNILEDSSSHRTFFQFNFDPLIKEEALSSYQNINREEHKNGYYAWTSSVEGYMCEDEKSKEIFLSLLSQYQCPINKNIFS